MQVSVGNNYGVVAQFNVQRNDSSSPASAVLWDLAYVNNSSGATSQAPIDAAKKSGYSPTGSYNYLNFPMFSPTNKHGDFYEFGYNAGVDFHGSDLVPVTGGASGRVEDSYGSQFNITVPIKTQKLVTSKFRVFLGSIGGHLFPVVNGYNVIAKRDWVNPFAYVDVIETELLTGQTKNINFTLMLGAMSAAPMHIGVRQMI
ncbi:hypothetical protein [Paenibacillus aquistagni]|uniref:hypothetical protein n=1 Tax=Paenibacillus aquistagni TaxID=1852522 RepID=UPI001482CB96|nr:hypothetical protein [Paenibacillus aquistagni]